MYNNNNHFSLEDLNKQLSALDLNNGRQLFLKKAEEINQQIEAESAATTKATSASKNGLSKNGTGNGMDDWSSDDIALLIKAVNVFPAGTVQR